MSMTIYDLNSQQLQELADLADLQRNGQIPTIAGLNFQLAALNGSFSSSQAPQQVALVAGVATVERLARINTVAIDTQSGAWADELDTMAWSGTGGPIAGDIYIFLLKTQVHQVTVTGVGNLRVGNGSFRMMAAESCIAFVVANDSSLVEWSRYPNVSGSEAALSRATSYVIGGGVNELPLGSKIVDAIALSAETLAEGSITIDTATAGRVEAWINEGAGGFMIGEYDWAFDDTVGDVAIGLATSVNGGTSYTAVANPITGEVAITAPVGTGSAANAYTLYTVVTTGITTTVVDIGVAVTGVDGTEAVANIDTFTGMEDGPIYIHNAMRAAALTLVAGGNISGTLPATIAAGAFKMILKVGTTYALPL
jgi:hypothetical protein